MRILFFILSAFSIVLCQYREAEPSEKCLKAFHDAVLSRTNSLRSEHNSSPLTADNNLESIAQNYSNFLAVKNLFQHSNFPNIGENLYAAFGHKFANNRMSCKYGDLADDCAAVGRAAVESWYNEVSLYDFKRPGFTFATGHFTQIVWKSTMNIGCGLSLMEKTCSAIVSCAYTPAGNINTMQHFAANVLPKFESNLFS